MNPAKRQEVARVLRAAAAKLSARKVTLYHLTDKAKFRLNPKYVP